MLAPDQMLGTYRLAHRIGAGGMGEVWRAEDTRLGRDVAIKILPPAVAADQEAIARMRREARTAASINHPNVATIHSFEEIDGRLFIVMELVAGESLARVIDRGPLAEADVCRIGRGIADALAEAHEKGIVHRDIKPDNVIVSGARVKVLDFGIAKQVGLQDVGVDDPTTPLTRQGMIIGTVTYMSPEQALGRPVDARTDLFSVGVVLYEAATGALPFRGETVTETITKIIRDEPAPPRVVNPRISPGLASIIDRCLRKDPNDRWANAAQLATALDQQAQNAPTILTGSQLQTVHELAPRGRPWLWPAVAATAGAIAATIALSVGPPDREPAVAPVPTPVTATQPTATTTHAVEPAAPHREPEPITIVEVEAPKPEPVPATTTTVPPPPSASVLYDEGIALLRQRRERDAAQKFRAAIETDPAHAAAHLRLGILALFARDGVTARKHLVIARDHRQRLSPRESKIADFSWALANDDRETARRLGRELHEEFPGDPEMRRFRDELGDQDRDAFPRPQRRPPFRRPPG